MDRQACLRSLWLMPGEQRFTDDDRRSRLQLAPVHPVRKFAMMVLGERVDVLAAAQPTPEFLCLGRNKRPKQEGGDAKCLGAVVEDRADFWQLRWILREFEGGGPYDVAVDRAYKAEGRARRAAEVDTFHSCEVVRHGIV